MVFALLAGVMVAEIFSCEVLATMTEPFIRSKFEVIILLTNYNNLNCEICSFRIDISNGAIIIF